jgi:hypothetical protein
LFYTHDIVTDRVNVRLEGTLIRHETSRVNPGKVKLTGRLKLGGVQAEGVKEMVIERTVEIGKRCVVIERSRRVMRVRELRITNIGTVDLKLRLSFGGTDEICGIGAVRAEELDGMVERKLLDSRIRLNSLLCLSDEHVLRGRRESGTFIGVEVDELGMNLVRITGESSTPRDSKLNIVVLKSD